MSTVDACVAQAPNLSRQARLLLVGPAIVFMFVGFWIILCSPKGLFKASLSTAGVC